ncbi:MULTISPECIES: ribonuclease III [Leuconostoc]|uniref:ribonuclease III n=1 Tax=Leuconostoc TaxID=1243 RepID=UPI0002737CDF|nr:MULTISPECIES: ribonuclease III [Leuconostoc]KDA48208.1 Ribonuclease III [Leuconostoc pseudomesenteroides 1159]KDA50122.1 Ribonuclease III [Leuconostoc pseudomesenteroides PS12]OQJ69221.1 ribonuclease III [Leuconostoc pseudomesenteroides]CCJ65714.1 Ribonuclease III [Leuconostoc pseudomesenteroides 4882]MDG9744617.1 ribonuclease III [Leuconostoc falkenbergense]
MSQDSFKKHILTQYGIRFNDESLLTEALTQHNYLNEHPEDKGHDYQRLEFLGDSVMQVTVAEYLFKRYPNWHEGQLTEMRIAMVQTRSFAHFARLVHLNEGIRLGKGEEMSGARDRDSLLEDIWEAFIGALYLDQGPKEVNQFLDKTLFAAIDTDFFDRFIDFKSRLQERLQVKGTVDIAYRTEREEQLADNTQLFEASVSVDDKELARGTGKSIKDAEKAAARTALKLLEDNVSL